MDISIFASTFIEPDSSSVAMLLCTTFSGDDNFATISQDSLLYYDPIQCNSILAKQENQQTVLSFHKGHCLGPNVCNCFKVMDDFERCGSVTGFNCESTQVHGEFLALLSTESSILEMSNSVKSHIAIRCFEPGENFFYIKNWCLTVVSADSSCDVSSPDVSKRAKISCAVPENLVNAGVQWLHGRDSAEVTDYILDCMFKYSDKDCRKVDMTIKHGVSILRAGNVTTLWHLPLERATLHVNSSTKSVGCVRHSPYDMHNSAKSPSTVLGISHTASGRKGGSSKTLLPKYNAQGEKRNISSISGGPCDNVSEALSNIKPPKGYISAFNYYVQTNRPTVLAENPLLEDNNNALNKLLGQLWKTLSVRDRKPYLDSAAEDKIRYCTQLEIYNRIMSKSDPSKIIIPRVSTNFSSSDTCTATNTSSNSSTAENLPCGHGMSKASAVSNTVIYRPRSAYAHFTRQEKQFVTAVGDKMKLQCVMGKYFAARWSFMEPQQKELYKMLEDDDKMEAKTLHISKMGRV